jgi:hypothetical protein
MQMAYNVKGLLLCWIFLNVSPEQKPIKNTNAELKNK